MGSALVRAKLMELRKRRGLMWVLLVFIVGIPVVVLGLRMIFHAAAPATHGPAGSPSIFTILSNMMAVFGFIVAAALGTGAATSDLSEGMFRHLVVTGRSRLSLYLARIPAGFAILLPLIAVGFSIVCLVTSYAGTPQPKKVQVAGVYVPVNLDRPALEHYLVEHPRQLALAFGAGGPGKGQGVTIGPGGPRVSPAAVAHLRREVRTHIGEIYKGYAVSQISQSNPAVNEMIKVGGWVTLELAMGFLVGLGLGSLMGQRTVATIIMIALQLVLTPLLAMHVIPYFINGQRLLVGLALDQLQPVYLSGGGFGGRGALSIPSMPTWAMVAVIVGWAVGWTVIGAWRMMTRDA
jgi:hypothetical protein